MKPGYSAFVLQRVTGRAEHALQAHPKAGHDTDARGPDQRGDHSVFQGGHRTPISEQCAEYLADFVHGGDPLHLRRRIGPR
jgi:hypothetical protein